MMAGLRPSFLPSTQRQSQRGGAADEDAWVGAEALRAAASAAALSSGLVVREDAKRAPG